MGKTNDFGTWLSNVALQGDQEVYDLYNSVSNFEGTGRFYTDKEIKNDGARYLVKADGYEDTLDLESDDIKFSFLEFLKNNYTDSADDDMQKWYELKKDFGLSG